MYHLVFRFSMQTVLGVVWERQLLRTWRCLGLLENSSLLGLRWGIGEALTEEQITQFLLVWYPGNLELISKDCYTNILEALNPMYFVEVGQGRAEQTPMSSSNVMTPVTPVTPVPQWPSLLPLALPFKGSATCLFAEDKAFNVQAFGNILDQMLAWNIITSDQEPPSLVLQYDNGRGLYSL